MKEKINMAVFFLDNKFIKDKEAKLKIDNEAFLYGFSLFETMRAYKRKIIYLDAHIDRLISSAKAVDLEVSYDKNELKDIILRTVKLNNYKFSLVRLILAKENTCSHLIVMVKKYKPLVKKYKTGFSACIFPQRQFSNNFLSRFKSGNYLFYYLAYQYAKKRNFDEAVILNEQNKIVEASRANIFWVKKDILFTPRLNCGCLPGITRKVIFDLSKRMRIKIEQVSSPLKELFSAGEAFLTNSLIGIMPLVRLEKRLIGKSIPGTITRKLMRAYEELYEEN